MILDQSLLACKQLVEWKQYKDVGLSDALCEHLSFYRTFVAMILGVSGAGAALV